VSSRGVLRIVESGVLEFQCPGCKDVHGVDAGWSFDGNYEKPTFSPSILVTSGHYARGHSGSCWCTFNEEHPELATFKCFRCHSYVTAGQIQFLGDSTHELVGKTVPLEPFP